jgi:hypothetical protein
MTRINAVRSLKETSSVAWGTKARDTEAPTWGRNTSALVFAAVLIICSVTVGCSSDKDQPKPVSSNNQIPVTQAPVQVQSMPAPVMQAATKPAPKKVVSRKPATVNYADKTYGVTFEYPRRYAIETGSAATELLASNPIAMNFVQPGGVALAAVELPETSFANTDFSSAFFNVSVHKSLTAEQCTEFAVPQPKPVAQMVEKTEPAAPASSTDVAKQDSTPAPKSDTSSAPVAATSDPATAAKSSSASSTDSNSKLMLGDLELRATEAVSGAGTRQSDSKYFHVFQNGSCYEFALNVTTDASEEGIVKHVDRDKVFNRLEQILATVKINPVTAPEVAAEAPTPTPAATPAQ